MLLRWLIAPVLVVPMLGCEGRTTTDIVPWSCKESSTQCPMPSKPAGLAGFWRFDAGDLEGVWRGDASGEPLWIECGELGGDWVSAGWKSCGSERLGGTGASLRLASAGYVDALLPKQLTTSSVTLAAWVSLARGAAGRISLLSVVRPECRSVWLDVLADGTTRRSLVLAVEKPGQTSETCDVEEVRAALPSGFLDWGLGNWYHVAAIVNGDERSLLVEGEPVGTSPIAPGEPTLPVSTSAVHIGESPSGELFSGIIDDVALFDRAVDPDDLANFALESIGVLSDGQHWTAWSADGSNARWKRDCRDPDGERSDQGASVAVDNGYWSTGGLRARVDTGHRIRSLKKVILVADIPEDEGFDFSLGSRHNAERCTWHVSGKGKSRYEFDLDRVNHCDCPSSCDCDFEVEEARVSSRWDTSTDLSFSVCGVEFEWGPDRDPIVELGPGGIQALNGWCWRPISYHKEAFADLDESLTGSKQTVGTVRGRDRQTAMLAADFAMGKPGEERKYCNLNEVTGIRLTADMPEGFEYQLRVADFYGVAFEWSRHWMRDAPTQEFGFCEGERPCGERRDPIRPEARFVKKDEIRYLGVQKNYEESADTTAITIKAVEFDPPGVAAGNCVISTSSGGAPPE